MRSTYNLRNRIYSECARIVNDGRDRPNGKSSRSRAWISLPPHGLFINATANRALPHAEKCAIDDSARAWLCIEVTVKTTSANIVWVNNRILGVLNVKTAWVSYRSSHPQCMSVLTRQLNRPYLVSKPPIQKGQYLSCTRQHLSVREKPPNSVNFFAE